MRVLSFSLAKGERERIETARGVIFRKQQPSCTQPSVFLAVIKVSRNVTFLIFYMQRAGELELQTRVVSFSLQKTLFSGDDAASVRSLVYEPINQ